jgi:hypothetical protein
MMTLRLESRTGMLAMFEISKWSGVNAGETATSEIGGSLEAI